jgi:hypothetical protein
MAADEDRRREIQQLRGDIAVLRVRINVELDRRGQRDLIVAMAKLLAEKTERLDELETPPGWIE